MRFKVKNLIIRVYTPNGAYHMFIKEETFNAKSRKTLRHVIGRHVLSLMGYEQQYYDIRGTAYENKDYTIEEVPSDIPRNTKYGYFNGTFYVMTDAYKWVAIPDADVTDEIREKALGKDEG